MNLFLKAKHWQLFLSTFGLTLTLNLHFGWSLLLGRKTPEFYPLLALIPILVNLCWLGSIGLCIQRLLPDALKMNRTKFRASLLILASEIIPLYLHAGFIQKTGSEHAFRHIYTVGTKYYFLSVPAILLAGFCLIYCCWFAARTIKTAETGRATRFSDFSGTFFAFFFYPMGIWNLQSRINRLGRPENRHLLLR